MFSSAASSALYLGRGGGGRGGACRSADLLLIAVFRRGGRSRGGRSLSFRLGIFVSLLMHIAHFTVLGAVVGWGGVGWGRMHNNAKQ